MAEYQKEVELRRAERDAEISKYQAEQEARYASIKLEQEKREAEIKAELELREKEWRASAATHYTSAVYRSSYHPLYAVSAPRFYYDGLSTSPFRNGSPIRTVISKSPTRI